MTDDPQDQQEQRSNDGGGGVKGFVQLIKQQATALMQ